MSRAVVRAALLHMLPSYLASIDVEAEPLLRQAGMVCEDLATGRVVRRSQIHEALALAARAAGSAEIGLALGRMASPEQLGPTGIAMTAGASVEFCLRTHIATMPVLQTHVELGLRASGAEAILAHRLVGDDEMSWLLYEGAAAFYVQMLRHLLGPDWAPARISFPHRLRGRRHEYEEFFQAPVDFGQHGESRIYLRRKELLRAPACPAASTRPLAHAGEQPVDPMRDKLADSDLLSAVVRMVESSLSDRPITLDRAARILGLSPRSMQRRLGTQGVTFEGVIDQTRHVIALNSLERRDESITALAMRLGYSDAAHFTRAFRRWELCAPIDYRKQVITTLRGPASAAADR